MTAQKLGANKGGKAAAKPPNKRVLKRKRDDEDLGALEDRVKSIDPATDQFDDFAQLPLSQATAKGLNASHYKTLTDIQKRAIPLALAGKDILGAAKTGSGKTLAFLIPLLENLHRRKWTQYDGLGALVLSPTRELAIQIFEVLRKVGRFHTFSAGLVIGGKALEEERERLTRMNILICTPGRMLQHMDQTAFFEIDNLQMLVLDEADRIMDMGFQKTVDAIVEHLPKQRQTMLFSATQTKRVSDLARLSLQSPEYVAVHEAADSATPSTLQQNYIVTPLPEKLDTLWSFIRSNTKAKILVFLSSGKQVRFVYEVFRQLQPGIPILHLHGRQKQTARIDITSKFSRAMHSCLFATDVIARGLDFPAVDWVIQLDCPEDADTYIHRVGRTARYQREGRAVLFLDPSEEQGMLKRLEQKKVTVEKINVREKKQQSIRNQLQNICFKDPEIKYLGQKAFVSYVKSVQIQKDKEVFRLSELALEEFSASLGLPGAPRIKFMAGSSAKDRKNAQRGAMLSSSEEDDPVQDETEAKLSKPPAVRTKYDRMFDRRNQDIFTEHYTKMIANADEASDANSESRVEEGFLSVKRRISVSCDDESDASDSKVSGLSNSKIIEGLSKDPIIIDSKRREKLLKSKKKMLRLKDRGSKLVFDDEGLAHEIYELEDEDQFKAAGPAEQQKLKYVEGGQSMMTEVDSVDKAMAKAKRKERRDRRKTREREGRENVEVTLAPYSDEENLEENFEPEIVDEVHDSHATAEDAPNLNDMAEKQDSLDSVSSRKSKKHKRKRALDIPENLNDLEDLASKLLEA